MHIEITCNKKIIPIVFMAFLSFTNYYLLAKFNSSFLENKNIIKPKLLRCFQ